jgi:hypothetical protein
MKENTRTLIMLVSLGVVVIIAGICFGALVYTTFPDRKSVV